MHTIRRWRRLAAWLAFLPPTTLVAGAALLTTSSLPAQATVGTNDYPAYLASAAKDSLVDPWNFYNRECTSFVAWRLNHDEGIPFTNHYKGAAFGNAYQWAGAAESVGIPVNGTPTPGSVAVYPASLPGSGGFGHVAYVDSVNNSAGTVTVEEYNFNVVGGYDQRIQAIDALGVQYIHFTTPPPPPPPPARPWAVFDPNDKAVEVYFRGADGALHERFWAAANGWSADLNLGSQITGDPTAMFDPNDGAVEVYFRGADGALHERFWTPANGWSADLNLGSQITGNPWPVYDPSDKAVEVYFRGADGALHERFWTAANGWSADLNLGSQITGDPTAMFDPNGAVEVYFRGADAGLHERFWTPANGWSADLNLGSSLA